MQPALQDAGDHPAPPQRVQGRLGSEASCGRQGGVSMRQAGLWGVHYRGNMGAMKIASSKLTAQGQISVPAEVRRRLGIGPGSVLEWEQQGEAILVRRAVRYSSEDVHRVLFAEPPRPRTLAELDEGLRQHVRDRRARR
jgi:antitoxin PrlF